METQDKTCLENKVSKPNILNILNMSAFIFAILFAGHLVFKKNPEKEPVFVKSDRPRAEFRSVDPNGNFYAYSYPTIDSPVDYLILKNEPSRYQNLEEVIAEYYPKTKPYLSVIEKSIEEHKSIFNLDPLIISILVDAESGGNPRAVSKAGAVGLMQLMPETAEEMGLPIYKGNWEIYLALKEARRNMIKAYNSALRAMRQENYERLIERSKKYNFYVNEADLLFQEYKRTLLENESLDDRLDPEKNIWAGVKYLAILARLNMDDSNMASLIGIIAAYNFRGEAAAREWTIPPIREPINHVNIVIEPYRILKPLAMKPSVVYVE